MPLRVKPLPLDAEMRMMSTALKARPRLLSKSRFKLGYDCPTKLFYTGKKEFENANDENEFLIALAEGGYQVGELAKLYYPGGVESEERDYDKACEATKQYLESGKTIIYEASLRHENLFARVDILNKLSKNSIELIEVKAKSFDSEDEEPFWNKIAKKKGVKELKAKWEPYLYDVAFQVFVARRAFPDIRFTPYLLLVNKVVPASVDSLNQMFPISRNSDGTTKVSLAKPASEIELGEELLIKVDVSEQVEFIIEKSRNGERGIGFEDLVEFLAKGYASDTKLISHPSSSCKKCEFYADKAKRAQGKRSGFHECWKSAFKTTDGELDADLVTDLWRYLGSSASLHSGLFRLKDLPESAINLKESEGPGLSQSERQLLQLRKVRSKDTSLYFNHDELEAVFSKFQYPLHFIDFETMSPAIPFHKGQRPYESIAFQFSHHKMEEDGSYHHENEFISSKPGHFPNFDFVRALYNAIGNCNGTVFRYSPHENTILNQIHLQLGISSEPDKKQLMGFIESITQKKTSKTSKEFARVGSRNMVDLFELLKWFYYDPHTHGSNSLKEVFPAILRRSKFLQEKYSKPMYGAAGGIRSKNFRDKAWIVMDSDGSIPNPYLSLPRIFDGMTFDESERLFGGEELREGGSASVAFARMQFEVMSEMERSLLAAALLRYCELDTLAMVMLVEHWKELLEAI